MKKILFSLLPLLVVTVSLFTSCASKSFITSRYKKSNTFTQDIYNQYSNKKIGVSVDMQAIYADSNAHQISRNRFIRETALINQQFNINLKANNFVFHIQNEFMRPYLDITTSMYFIPNIQLNDTASYNLKQDKYSNNIYCCSNSTGSIIQLFRIPEKSKLTKLGEQFNEECDFIGKNIHFQRSYKRLINDKVFLINESLSKDSKEWNINTIQEMAIKKSFPKVYIADINDEGKMINIKLPKYLFKKIGNQALYISIYKEIDIKQGDLSTPIKKHEVYSPDFEFRSIPSIGNSYILIHDSNQRIFDIIYVFM